MTVRKSIGIRSPSLHLLRSTQRTRGVIGVPQVAEPVATRYGPGMDRLIACRMATYRDCQDAAWTHLPEVGIRYLETWLPAPDAVDTLRRKLGESGLTLVMLDGKCDITADNHTERLATQLDLCMGLRCPLYFLSVKAGAMAPEEVYRRLRHLGEEADRRDLTVVLETHPDLLTNARLARQTLAGVDHPRVRINFDPANICYYNVGLDPVAELRQIVAFVGAVHLKDSTGRVGAWHFPTLGAGVVDFPAMFAVLDAHGFTGPCSIELEGIQGTKQTTEKVKQEVEASLVHLREIGAMS